MCSPFGSLISRRCTILSDVTGSFRGLDNEGGFQEIQEVRQALEQEEARADLLRPRCGNSIIVAKLIEEHQNSTYSKHQWNFKLSQKDDAAQRSIVQVKCQEL
jgi:hypothetical protein